MTLQVVVPKLHVITHNDLHDKLDEKLHDKLDEKLHDKLDEKLHEKVYDELSLKKLLFNRFEDIFKELMPSTDWKIRKMPNSIEIVEKSKELDSFSLELIDNERTLRVISPSKISSFQVVVYMKTSMGLDNILKFLFENVYRYYSELTQKM